MELTIPGVRAADDLSEQRWLGKATNLSNLGGLYWRTGKFA